MIKIKIALSIFSIIISMTLSAQTTLELTERKGALPELTDYIPHQQLTENSPKDILQKYEEWMFSLPHVKVKPSINSFPSARGIVIERGVKMNPILPNREFTHIHYEPEPGSLHVFLPKEDADYIVSKKWGVYHPLSLGNSRRPFIIVLVFSPRNEEDLTELKKIVERAHQFALSS